MSKILSTAIVAGLLFGITAPAFAADPPKTKAECAKADRHEVGCEDQDVSEEVKLNNKNASSQRLELARTNGETQ